MISGPKSTITPILQEKDKKVLQTLELNLFKREGNLYPQYENGSLNSLLFKIKTNAEQIRKIKKK